MKSRLQWLGICIVAGDWLLFFCWLSSILIDKNAAIQLTHRNLTSCMVFKNVMKFHRIWVECLTKIRIKYPSFSSSYALAGMYSSVLLAVASLPLWPPLLLLQRLFWRWPALSFCSSVRFSCRSALHWVLHDGLNILIGYLFKLTSNELRDVIWDAE